SRLAKGYLRVVSDDRDWHHGAPSVSAQVALTRLIKSRRAVPGAPGASRDLLARGVPARPPSASCSRSAIEARWASSLATTRPTSDPPRSARNLPLGGKWQTRSTCRAGDQAAGHEPALSALGLAALIKHYLRLATSTRLESSVGPNTPFEPTRWPRR